MAYNKNMNSLNINKITHLAEIEFVKNYFAHKNWVYQPACFHLRETKYTPDFYDGERNVFIEIVGTTQAFYSNKDKYLLFKELFPRIILEFRDKNGEICFFEKDNNIKPVKSITYIDNTERAHAIFEKELADIECKSGETLRKEILERLRSEREGSRLKPLAERIGLSYVTLWRILNGKTFGSTTNWDKIFNYYKK